MSDLTSKTVDELREDRRRSHSYDGMRTIESCVPQAAFDELARRLEEAQQRSEAHDAVVEAAQVVVDCRQYLLDLAPEDHAFFWDAISDLANRCENSKPPANA